MLVGLRLSPEVLAGQVIDLSGFPDDHKMSFIPIGSGLAAQFHVFQLYFEKFYSL